MACKLRKKMSKLAKKEARFILKHAIIFGLIGLILALFLHHYILTLRNAQECGFFCVEWLITATEMAWWFIGASLIILFTGLGTFVGYKRGKKR